MAKQRFQPNPNADVSAPVVPPESEKDRKERLKRAVDGVLKALRDNRAVLAVNSIQIVDGRMIPNITVQVLR